jgi:hypothetical protein
LIVPAMSWFLCFLHPHLCLPAKEAQEILRFSASYSTVHTLHS